MPRCLRATKGCDCTASKWVMALGIARGGCVGRGQLRLTSLKVSDDTQRGHCPCFTSDCSAWGPRASLVLWFAGGC